MCGRATLAMAVSRSSMKVASVTVMAMTQGFTAGRSPAIACAANGFGTGKDDVVALIACYGISNATRDRSVSSNYMM